MNFQFMAVLQSKLGLNPIEALFLSDVFAGFLGNGFSYTYASSHIRYVLSRFVDRGLIVVYSKTIDDDPQAYQFYGVTRRGLEMLEGMLK